MEEDMNYEDTVKASEEAIKNALNSGYYQPDNFNFKINNEFFMGIYFASKQNKEFGLIQWFIRSMNKANIIHNVIATKMMIKANMSKATYYKALVNLTKENIMIKIDKKTFMINPNIIINHRKSTNKDRPQLLALWSEYKRQASIKNQR